MPRVLLIRSEAGDRRKELKEFLVRPTVSLDSLEGPFGGQGRAGSLQAEATSERLVGRWGFALESE